MHKNVFYRNIYISLVLLSLVGCAERGYKLSTNIQTQTTIAQETSDLKTSKSTEKEQLDTLSKAVKKVNQQKEKKTFNSYKKYTTTLENIIFKRTIQTYVKFGNSEIHGHVIYMNGNGLAKGIKDTKVYLAASTKKLDHWYTHFFLKNKTDYLHTTMIHYLNTTTLDISKNFIFYGVPKGSYYIIIVSTKANKEGKNQQIYIAKQIDVKKHKKIMIVFSKKL